MTTLSENQLRDFARKERMSEQDADIFIQAANIIASEQKNSSLKFNQEVLDQVSELAWEIGEKTQSKSYKTFMKWEKQLNKFCESEYNKIWNNELYSEDKKNFGAYFLHLMYTSDKSDFLVELYQLGNVIQKLNGKTIQQKNVEQIFGTGFVYENSAAVKRINDFHKVSIARHVLSHEKPVTFPIVSYDTVTNVQYDIIVEEDYNIHFRFELNEFNLREINFTFAIY